LEKIITIHYKIIYLFGISNDYLINPIEINDYLNYNYLFNLCNEHNISDEIIKFYNRETFLLEAGNNFLLDIRLTKYENVENSIISQEFNVEFIDILNTGLKNSGVKIIYLPDLATVGTLNEAKVSETIRTYFLQAWLAFACANTQVKVMWQSPGTIWMDRPDNIVNIAPIVETLWSYKGRDDKRAAPFFASYDFFAPTGAERPIHLMHEILLHFDN
jgi:hypothetical protein